MAKTPSVAQAVASNLKAAPKKRNKSIVSKLTADAPSVPSKNVQPEASAIPVVLVKAAANRSSLRNGYEDSGRSPVYKKENSALKGLAAKGPIATKSTKAKTNTATKTAEPEKSWYDYPHYYDVGFREDTPREAKFFEKAFAKYIPGKVKRLFEPGCGSGRLVVEMADRGFQ